MKILMFNINNKYETKKYFCITLCVCVCVCVLETWSTYFLVFYQLLLCLTTIVLSKNNLALLKISDCFGPKKWNELHC